MTKKIGLAVFAILLAIAFIYTSCGDNGKVANEKVEEIQEEKPENEFAAQMNLPDACSFISVEELQEIIGDAVSDVLVKDATNSHSKHARSCFFRWEHEGTPNSGILTQVQSNPLPDEFPTWPKVFIESKKTSGEKGLIGGGEEITYLYKDFPVGIDGAYNFELGKYFWRVNEEHVYMLACNLPVEEEKVLEWATFIATLIIDRSK